MDKPVTFAGFEYPRYIGHVGMLDTPLAKRLAKYKANKASNSGKYRAFTGGYYQDKPAPVGRNAGRMFYHGSDFMPGLRWSWCDRVKDVGRRLDHTGWFTDDYQDQRIRGLVFRLPAGRGFLAGWTYDDGRPAKDHETVGMVGELEYRIYDNEREAAYAADGIAEGIAEKERIHNEEEEERIKAEEAEEERKREEEEFVANQLEKAGWV